MPTPPRRAGFTLVEMMVALLVAAILMGAISWVLIYSQRNQANSAAVAQMENDAHEAVGRVADELRQAGSGGPGWSFSATAITYNPCTGSTSGTLTWDTTRSLLLAAEMGETLADGVDNNGNGLRDEGMLVLSGAGIWEPWVSDIASNGLVFSRSGNNITISLTLQRLNPSGSPITTTASTTVSLRN